MIISTRAIFKTLQKAIEQLFKKTSELHLKDQLVQQKTKCKTNLIKLAATVY